MDTQTFKDKLKRVVDRRSKKALIDQIKVKIGLKNDAINRKVESSLCIAGRVHVAIEQRGNFKNDIKEVLDPNKFNWQEELWNQYRKQWDERKKKSLLAHPPKGNGARATILNRLEKTKEITDRRHLQAQFDQVSNMDDQDFLKNTTRMRLIEHFKNTKNEWEAFNKDAEDLAYIDDLAGFKHEREQFTEKFTQLLKDIKLSNASPSDAQEIAGYCRSQLITLRQQSPVHTIALALQAVKKSNEQALQLQKEKEKNERQSAQQLKDISEKLADIERQAIHYRRKLESGLEEHAFLEFFDENEECLFSMRNQVATLESPLAAMRRAENACTQAEKILQKTQCARRLLEQHKNKSGTLSLVAKNRFDIKLRALDQRVIIAGENYAEKEEVKNEASAEYDQSWADKSPTKKKLEQVNKMLMSLRNLAITSLKTTDSLELLELKKHSHQKIIRLAELNISNFASHIEFNNSQLKENKGLMIQLKLGFLWARSFIPFPLFLALYKKESRKVDIAIKALESQSSKYNNSIQRWNDEISTNQAQLSSIEKKLADPTQNGSEKTTACLKAIANAFQEDLSANSSTDVKAKNNVEVDYTAEERLRMRIVGPQLCLAAQNMLKQKNPDRRSAPSFFRQDRLDSERHSFELITPDRTSLTACGG